jgi:transcriptional regulator with XRE-family HTH domain
METSIQQIGNQIKEIRKLKQRNIHDCAKLLGVTKEQYLQFEEGEGSLSLPEIELLSIFLEIPAENLFEEFDDSFSYLTLANERKSPVYKNLRNKMIQTKLASVLQDKEISLENLSQFTNIPLESLQSYQVNGKAIPIDHLNSICKHIGIPFEALIMPKILDDKPVELLEEQQARWQPEYTEIDSSQNHEDENLYQPMIEAMKRITEKDRAEIAKIILEKLKSS